MHRLQTLSTTIKQLFEVRNQTLRLSGGWLLFVVGGPSLAAWSAPNWLVAAWVRSSNLPPNGTSGCDSAEKPNPDFSSRPRRGNRPGRSGRSFWRSSRISSMVLGGCFLHLHGSLAIERELGATILPMHRNDARREQQRNRGHDQQGRKTPSQVFADGGRHSGRRDIDDVLRKRLFLFGSRHEDFSPLEES